MFGHYRVKSGFGVGVLISLYINTQYIMFYFNSSCALYRDRSSSRDCYLRYYNCGSCKARVSPVKIICIRCFCFDEYLLTLIRP